MQRIFSLLLVVILIPACSVNPVTGQRSLNFMSEEWERSVGAELYGPLRQAQGGDYILDPDLTRYVRNVGNSLARHSARDLDYEFHILNDSTPNAWALPGGKIVVHRGLLTELNSEAELAAVIGHEITHADAAHGAQAQSRGVLTQVGSVAAMVALGTQVDSQQAQQLGMLGIQVGAQLVTSKYGRDAERQSDAYGMKMMSEAGYDPWGAVELQETFVEISQRAGRGSDWLSGLFASHPPSAERVENNRELAAQLPRGGETGRQAYQNQVAYLRRMEPAYEAHDEGRKALADNDLRKARRLAQQALDMEPRESRFHALLADTYAEDRDYRRAERSYSDAISRDRGFFYNYLRRGLVRQELNDRRGAQSDLEQSLSLLPTAQAHLGLGNLAQAGGDQRSAVAHYQEAAKGGNSPAAIEAHRELARLNPGQYVQVQTALDRSGNAVAIIRNQAPAEMIGVALRVEYINTNGRRGDTTQTVNQRIEPGQTINVPIRVGRFQNVNDMRQRLRVTIAGAQAR